MTNIQAAIGVAQFAEIDKILDHKCRIAQRYRRELSAFSEFQVSDMQNCSNWINTIKLNSIERTKEVYKEFERNHIEVRPGFSRIDEMPMLN